MVTIISSILIMIFLVSVRLSYKIMISIIDFIKLKKNKNCKRIMVIGAGDVGLTVINACKTKKEYNMKVVTIIDDDIKKLGTYVAGIKVEGTRNDILKIFKEKKIDEIIIAIAHLSSKELKKLLDICKNTNSKVKIVPSVSEIINGSLILSKIRDVQIEDLLEREPVNLSFQQINNYVQNKIILVTGGGGSIGSEICRQLIKFKPKEIIIFDIYENNAYDIENEIKDNENNVKVTTLIGSVRDRDRLRNVFRKYEVQVVFHAAAHKHVPLMEESPFEAIKNNVIGTLNVAEISSEAKVDNFVLISTDKAVNPTSVMGASKRICEMIIQGIDKISSTKFVAVRFGNVLGSNGSVVPLFKKQIINGGPITLTHKDITRYFMTIPEAAQLVIQAGAYAKGGEIFVLDMGKPVKIIDLAKNLISLSGLELGKDIDIKITGLRPGEKLYEELLMNEEGLVKTSNKKIYIGKPSEIDYKWLKNEIYDLLYIGSTCDYNRLINKIKEIVPTYTNSKGGGNVAI